MPSPFPGMDPYLEGPLFHDVHQDLASEIRAQEVWPIQLSEPLPVVAVPLRPPDPDVTLDLQVALSNIYDRARYDLSIDYSRQPDPPLVGDDAVWAADWLRAQAAASNEGVAS